MGRALLIWVQNETLFGMFDNNFPTSSEYSRYIAELAYLVAKLGLWTGLYECQTWLPDPTMWKPKPTGAHLTLRCVRCGIRGEWPKRF